MGGERPGSSVESGIAPSRSEADDAPSAASERPYLGRHGHAWAVEELGPRWFAAGVAACTLAIAIFGILQANARAPFEDETLALFVGRHSLGTMFDIVLGQRGGAPLHFLLAWLVAHLGGGLVALRLVSVACTVAAIPVIALLCARLGGRTIGLVATALVGASWIVLFQAVFGRMYALFLLTSSLSYLALIVALERGGRRRWALWVIATLATVATHPYGLLVLASQGLFVLLLRQRIREAIWAFAVVVLVGTPFWVADLVLSRRFDVGVGGGGAQLGAPGPVARYLSSVATDTLSQQQMVTGILVGIGAVGLLFIARTRPATGLLVGSVLGVPTVALLGAHLGNQASPESRHMIFALPFLALAIAAGFIELGGRRLRSRLIFAGIAVAVILPLQIQSAWTRTPELFIGSGHARARARDAAAEWLASSSRPDDILFGYDPVFLVAWEKQRNFSDTVVPRADGGLAAHVVSSATSLGRGVWVLDAGDESNDPRRPTIQLHYPKPRSAFDARVFGPYLVIRTKEPTVTPKRYFELAASAMRLGRSLAIVDDDQNLHTIELAQGKLKLN